MTAAFIFPGQGSQAIGMGKALYEAFPASRAVFEEVDSALGQKLSTLMFDGDIAELGVERCGLRRQRGQRRRRRIERYEIGGKQNEAEPQHADGQGGSAGG